MLWYKTWLETRLRFLISAAAVTVLCAFYVFFRPIAIDHMRQILQLHPDWHRPWWVDRALNEYRFYIWRSLYDDELRDLWMVCAVLIGVGGLTQEGAKGSATFTLALPVRRRRLSGVHAFVSCLELAVLAIVPSVVLPALSPFVGGSYSIREAAERGLLLASGGLLVFGFTFAVSALTESAYVPVVVGIAALVFLASILEPYRDGLRDEPLLFRSLDVFKLVSGMPDWKWSSLSWTGVTAAMAVALMLIGFAIRVMDAHDYR